MGGGASLENTQLITTSPSLRFYCHSCRNIFIASENVRRSELSCPRCQSSFLEDFNAHPYSNHNGYARNNLREELSDEQARRLANAAIMLRLLEIQLRDELEHLQNMYNASRQDSTNPCKPMTQTMIDKIRNPPLTVDMVCSQPSCPICSEDFDVANTALQMPCSHLFHDVCVMPWLESKKTCPICRYELNDSLPTLEELDRFTEDELVTRLNKYTASSSTASSKTKRELMEMLLLEMKNEKDTAMANCDASRVGLLGSGAGGMGVSSSSSSSGAGSGVAGAEEDTAAAFLRMIDTLDGLSRFEYEPDDEVTPTIPLPLLTSSTGASPAEPLVMTYTVRASGGMGGSYTVVPSFSTQGS